MIENVLIFAAGVIVGVIIGFLIGKPKRQKFYAHYPELKKRYEPRGK